MYFERDIGMQCEHIFFFIDIYWGVQSRYVCIEIQIIKKLLLWERKMHLGEKCEKMQLKTFTSSQVIYGKSVELVSFDSFACLYENWSLGWKWNSIMLKLVHILWLLNILLVSWVQCPFLIFSKFTKAKLIRSTLWHQCVCVWVFVLSTKANFISTLS